MIIYLLHNIHTHKACPIEYKLPLKVVHTVLMLHQGAVRRGAVQHNQSKTNQEYQNGKQVKIKETNDIPASFLSVPCFPCFLFSYSLILCHIFTLPSYLLYSDTAPKTTFKRRKTRTTF